MIAARSCGLAAIAVPGTSSWQPAWAEQLTGKYVTLVMDCDPPGRSAAAKIAASLSAAGIRVDVVDLGPGRSDGYDLTDRILERRRQHPGPLNARAAAALLRPLPTVDHTRPPARARSTQGKMTEIPEAGSSDYTGAAHAAILAAVGAEHDFGGWLAGFLATVAADLGSIRALTAGRPGSWEAEHVRGLVNGTVGWADDYVEHYKTPLA